MLGQMRLTWWHDALTRLDAAPPPAEPVLGAVAAELLPIGVTGTDLAALVAGWEELLEPELDDEGLMRHARERGGRLFTLAGRIVGMDRPAQIGRAHVWTPVTNAQLVCRLLLEKKKK